MSTRVLAVTISALVLTYGATGVIAQDRMMPQAAGQEGASTMGQGGGMMGRGMMGGDMMGGTASGAAMGPPPMVLRFIFALVDSDGDGTISLPEFQAAHERIFKAMDSNKDGKLTQEEMQAFMHGRSAPQ
jgi:hypothetical protein